MFGDRNKMFEPTGTFVKINKVFRAFSTFDTFKLNINSQPTEKYILK